MIMTNLIIAYIPYEHIITHYMQFNISYRIPSAIRHGSYNEVAWWKKNY